MVLLRTPPGAFTAAVGTTDSGGRVCNLRTRTTATGRNTGTGFRINASARTPQCSTTAVNSWGFNSFVGYHPDSDVALVFWTNLTLSPESRTTAQAMLPTILNEIYPGLSL